MSQELSRSGSRRTRVLGLCLAGLIGLVVVVYEVELMRGRGAWRDYERDALSRGVKLKFADYIPPKIPDAENFASTPIFDAVFRASDAGQAVDNPFKLVQSGPAEPKLADFWPQRSTSLAAWQQYLIKEKILPHAGESDAADVLLVLQRFDSPLQELSDAGKRPHCRFPVHWEKGFDATLPHFGTLQISADRYALRLSAHLALGESAAAYQDFHDGLRMATAIREEPTIISGLVRISIGAKMLNCVWDGLAKHQWAAPELQKIESDLSALDWLGDYTFSLNCERGSSSDFMDTMIRDPDEYFRSSGTSGSHPWSDSKYLRIYPRGWIYQSKLRMNRFIDEMTSRVEPAHHRYFGQRPVPSDPGGLVTVPQRVRYLFFFMAAPVLSTIEIKYLQVASITDMARIACALECFRLKRGAYPEALSELVPEFILELPAEVVNGDPYRYRRTVDGLFLLYSVGTDLRDDGGVLNPALSPSKQPDWIWSYPPK